MVEHGAAVMRITPQDEQAFGRRVRVWLLAAPAALFVVGLVASGADRKWGLLAVAAVLGWTQLAGL